MLFTGTYRRSLDEKQRLPIPKPLREELPAGSRLYLTPGMDGCLAAFPAAAFEAQARRLEVCSPGSRDVRDYSRVFYSQAVCVVPDSQWRIRVPADLVRRVHLEGEVAVVGVRDHLEIWSAATWDAYIARCEGQYEHLAELAWDAAGPRELGSSPAGVLQGNLHGGDANAPPLPR